MYDMTQDAEGADALAEDEEHQQLSDYFTACMNSS